MFVLPVYYSIVAAEFVVLVELVRQALLREAVALVFHADSVGVAEEVGLEG